MRSSATPMDDEHARRSLGLSALYGCADAGVNAGVRAGAGADGNALADAEADAGAGADVGAGVDAIGEPGTDPETGALSVEQGGGGPGRLMSTTPHAARGTMHANATRTASREAGRRFMPLSR